MQSVFLHALSTARASSWRGALGLLSILSACGGTATSASEPGAGAGGSSAGHTSSGVGEAGGPSHTGFAGGGVGGQLGTAGNSAAGDSSLGGAAGDLSSSGAAGDLSSSGAGGDSGDGAGGAPDAVCYSPSQNLRIAYQFGAHGCPCIAGSGALCVQGVGLVCSHGAWQSVYDGPCAPPPPPPMGKSCGGFTGSTCTDTEYCAYIEGQLCGQADASALCKPRPTMCTQIEAPVCGCDQKTYDSPCSANAAGTGIYTAGACQ